MFEKPTPWVLMTDDEIRNRHGRGEFELYAHYRHGAPVDATGVPLPQLKGNRAGRISRLPPLKIVEPGREFHEQLGYTWVKLTPAQFSFILVNLGLRAARRDRGIPRWIVGNDPRLRGATRERARRR
jgi:hypothetical protein